MKRNDFITRLSELTKIAVDKLTSVLTSGEDEIDVEIPKLHVFTDDEINARDLQNARAGNTTVIKQAIRDYRDKMKKEFPDEFEFDDKTMDNLVQAAMKAGEKKANVKPNEKVQELEKTISALRKNLESVEAEKTAAVSDREKALFDYKLDSMLSKKVPFIEGSAITATEYVSLFKLSHIPQEVDGIISYKENGDIAKDPKTLKPIPIDQKFESWLMEKGVKPGVDKGRGAGDMLPKKFQIGSIDSIQTSEDFEKYCEAQKISENNFTKRSEILREVQKKNPEFRVG